MAQLHYIDNEVPTFGEWDSITDAGASDISQDNSVYFDERGSWSLKCEVVNSVTAYAKKNFGSSCAALSVGFWFRFETPTWSDGEVFWIATAENEGGCPYGWILRFSNYGGNPRLDLRAYAGNTYGAYYDLYYLVADRWYYVTVIAEWTSCRWGTW